MTERREGVNKVNNKNAKILLADDEPDVQRMLARRLVSEGYQVVTASDGEEAILKAFQEKPDVILLDIMLPKKNGNIVAAELQEKPETAGIPIIFITCLVNTNEARVMQYRSGGNTIMGKPIDSNDLMQLIERSRMAA